MNIRIKEVMSEKGITSAALANLVGISKVAVSNFVTGKSTPSIERLEQIADVLNIPLWQLFVDPSKINNELTAFVECQGVLMTAHTISELEGIITSLKEKFRE